MLGSRRWFPLLFVAVELLNCACLLQHRWPAVPVASPPLPPPPVPQFSVVWDKHDLNGMPMNPQWAEQRDSNQLPPVPRDENQNSCVRHPDTKGQCTAQDVLVDDQTPNLFWRAICLFTESKIHGHVDWMPATYYGQVNWIHINPGDSDYNLRMFPYDGNTPIQNGLTYRNNDLGGAKYIEMEFDSNETSGRYRTPTWQAFDDAANNLDTSLMNAWLDPVHKEDRPFAVVTGLFNLDCEHDCRSELHPVYSLAVEQNDSADDNTWAILVRNWGNGGSCSGYNQQLDLPGGQFSVVLPITTGAPTVLWDKVEFAVSESSIPFPKTSFVAGVGFVLTFTLPDPNQRALIELALHLKWPSGKPAPARMKLPLPGLVAKALVAAGNEEDAGDYVGKLFEAVGGKSAAPRLESLAASARNQLATAKPQKVQKFQRPKEIPRKTPPSLIHPVADPIKEARDTALFRSLCTAYRNQGKQLPSEKVPQLPALCESAEMK